MHTLTHYNLTKGMDKIKVVTWRQCFTFLCIVNVVPAVKITSGGLKSVENNLKSLDELLKQLRSNLTASFGEVTEETGAFISGGHNKPSMRELSEDDEKVGMRSTGATAADVIAIVDSTINGYMTDCKTGILTGWTLLLDEYWSNTATSDSATAYFSTSTGTFTAPAAGWYNICGFLRFLKGGDAGDVTIRHNGAIVAVFGDAVGLDWRSTGTCLIREMAAGDTVYFNKEHASGHGNCIEETGWFYSRFSTYLIAPSS